MTNDTGHLKTQASELVKQHIVYDDLLRIEFVYTVRADATDGTPCSVVRYAYESESTRVSFMKETLGVWDGSWDVF